MNRKVFIIWFCTFISPSSCIIGGEIATSADFFVQIFRDDGDCGGIAFHRYGILTTAHCVYNLTVPKADGSKMGVDIFIGSIKIEKEGKRIEVEKYFIHEAYLGNYGATTDVGIIQRKQNDIAIIVTKNATAEKHIVRLSQHRAKASQTGTFYGIGIIEGGRYPDYVMKRKFSVKKNKGLIGSMFATEFGVTNADSGGPFIWSEQNLLGGILVGGNDEESLFVNTYDFLRWINVRMKNVEEERGEKQKQEQKKPETHGELKF